MKSLFDLVEAYKSLILILKLSLPFSKARSIKLLFDRLSFEYNFYCSEEEKLIKKYAKQNENGIPIVTRGHIHFLNTADRDSYLKEIQDLNSLEIAFDCDLIIISENEIGDQKISASSIIALSNFIQFE